MSNARDGNVAEIQFVNNGVQPMLKVLVPKGTTLADSLRLGPTISEMLRDLRGCAPCNSGIPVFFHEREELERVVRVDLGSLKRIG